MPVVPIRKTAFNAGELAETLMGRSDVPAYAAGCRRLLNWLVLRAGGIERRPGTIHVAMLGDESRRATLRSFRFSKTDAFTLELTEGQLRVYAGNALVLFATHTLAATAATLPVTNEIEVLPAHGFTDGLLVHITPQGGGTLPAPLTAATDYLVRTPPTFSVLQGAGTISVAGDTIDVGAHTLTNGMGPFRLRSTGALPSPFNATTDYYVVGAASPLIQLSTTPAGAPVNIATTGTGTLTIRPTDAYARSKLRLEDAGGTIVNTTTVGTGLYTLGPPTAVPFVLPGLPWVETQLPELQFAAQRDVLYVTHKNTELRRLVRYANHAWQLETPELLDGPYLNEQQVYPFELVDAGVTLTPAATTGNVVVTASKAIFAGTDIGRVVRVGQDGDPRLWGWGRIVGIVPLAFTDFNLRSEPLDGMDAGLNHVVSFGHNFFDGEGPVRVDRNANGLNAFVDYWVHRIDASKFSLHLSKAAALADTGRVNLTGPGVAQNFTSSTIELVGHGLSEGDVPVGLSTSGALPLNFSTAAAYFVRVWDADSFALSLTPGGDPIAVNFPNGYGTHTIHGSGGLSDQVTVQVVEAFPVATAQHAWKLGAFGADPRLGWPAAVTLNDQRLVLGGAPGQPQVIHASNIGDPVNFAPDEDDPDSGAPATARIRTVANAFSADLASEDLNVNAWLRGVRKLLAGGLGGIFQVLPQTSSQALSGQNIDADRGTTHGSSDIAPVVLGSSVFFVDESRKHLVRAEFRPDIESIDTEDLSVLAEHLGEESRLGELCRTESPQPIIFSKRDDGTVVALTFDQTQEVRAWARITVGGPGAVIESITAQPDTHGGALWMAVARVVDGVTRRSVERMARRFELGDDPLLLQTLDAGLEAYNGAPISVLTGLAHLEGMQVYAIADGAEQGPFTVSGGQITLTTAASKIVVGLMFENGGELTPLEITEAGSTQSVAHALQKPVRILVRLYRTRLLQIGHPDLLEDVLRRTPDMPMDTPLPLQTGVFEVTLEWPTERDQGIAFTVPGAHPGCILSMQIDAQIAPRG